MKRYLIIVVYTCVLILLLGGCKTEEIDLNEGNDSHEQEQNILLQEKIDELEDRIKEIEKDNILTYRALEEWYEEFDQKYPLLRVNTWDKVIISKPWDDNEVIITDKRMITAIRELIGAFREAGEFGSGPFSDVPNYQYTFIKDGEELTIDVVARDIIRIDYDYYSTSTDIHLLGNALLPPPAYLEGDIPIITKLALSGYMEVESDYSYGMFSSFRIISIASALAELGELLTYAPIENSEVSFTLDFYFFGEKITLTIYEENYIQFTNGDEEYWFFTNDTHIFEGILNAS